MLLEQALSGDVAFASLVMETLAGIVNPKLLEQPDEKE